MTLMRFPRPLAVLAAVGIALAAGSVAAQQFSAEMVNTGTGGQSHVTKIYVSDGKIRIESAQRQGFLIADSKAKTSYVVMPQQKMYMDMPNVGGSMMQVFMPADPNDACKEWQHLAMATNGDHGAGPLTSCHRVGTEMIGGRSAIKYEGVTRKGEHAYAWVDPKLDFILKAESASGHGTELRNIQEGAQPASLFAIPADFHKMDMKGMMAPNAKPTQ